MDTYCVCCYTQNVKTVSSFYLVLIIQWSLYFRPECVIVTWYVTEVPGINSLYSNLDESMKTAWCSY